MKINSYTLSRIGVWLDYVAPNMAIGALGSALAASLVLFAYGNLRESRGYFNAENIYQKYCETNKAVLRYKDLMEQLGKYDFPKKKLGNLDALLETPEIKKASALKKDMEKFITERRRQRLAVIGWAACAGAAGCGIIFGIRGYKLNKWA